MYTCLTSNWKRHDHARTNLADHLGISRETWANMVAVDVAAILKKNVITLALDECQFTEARP